MNKKIIYIIALGTIITGCTNNKLNNVDNVDKPKKTTVEVVELKSKEEQDKIIGELNSKLEIKVTPREIIGFVDENIEGLSKENASILVMGIEKSQLENMGDFSKEFFNQEREAKMMEEYEVILSNQNYDQIKDEEVRLFLKDVRENGFRVDSSEGMFFPVSEYEVYKKYSKYVTNDVKDYIDIMATETNELSSSDAAIVITYEEVYDRLVNHEEFIKKYPEFENINQMKQQFEMYARYFIFGSANTPVFGFQDKVVGEKIQRVYKEVVENNNENEFTTEFKKYYEVLKKNEFKDTKEVQDAMKVLADKFIVTKYR